MKDAFGREIREGDIVVYATRNGSTTCMNVARVLKAEVERVRIHSIAGTSYEWTYGHSKYDSTTKKYNTSLHEGHEAWLRASGNVVVSNGIDAAGIHDNVMAKQRENIAARQ